MDYKKTLNLPTTSFAMKANLPQKEPAILASWRQEDIYAKLKDKYDDAREKFILHDGPPYANGNIHIGHALNKVLKDIIIKYKSMRGCNCSYVPGWDCHGLPVEHQLFKDLRINKYQISQVEFRKKAHDYALKYVSTQREQFIRLGIFADWQNPYLTLTPDYEESILCSLADLVDKGYVYRGLKPVNWCFRCETALAEAEVEYDNHVSPSVFVKFKLQDSKDSFLLIWTTTPWTLIANVAVAVHPEFTYCYLRTDKGSLVVAKDLLDNVVSKAGIEKYEIVNEVKGRSLDGLVYDHPFGLRKGKVVLADYVSREDGSGLVHTAPGHGNDDYFTGLKYKLDIVMPVDGKGKFDSSAGEFEGVSVFEANKSITAKLADLGYLLWEGSIQHSYPHCWRCKNPVIFRATKQWFLRIDHQDLRKKILSIIDSDVAWVPASGKERISSMVQTRPDWCLSRQRYWGVPIPALVCQGCNEEVLDARVVRKLASVSSKDGTDSWFNNDIRDFLPDAFSCPHCGSGEFKKGADILDVWFDSGVSHQAVLKRRPGMGGTPAELYLEGSDQHRGWFQSSIIPSVAIDGKAPFKTVLTHGFVVDGQGRKMSKSLGNVISPQDVIKDSGADILRLWVASSDYNEDIRVSPDILLRLSEGYRKIRNTVRFILSNLYDFNPAVDKVGFDEFNNVDLWALFVLKDSLLEPVRQAYERFEFYKAYQKIYDFCNIELSSLYLDMVKGRLYTFASSSRQRRAAQTVIYEVLSVLVRVMAPIFAFTAEEIWQVMPKEVSSGKWESVHLSEWPDADLFLGHEERFQEISASMPVVISLIPEAAKALEEMRARGDIGSSFDAKIKLLTNNDKSYKFFNDLNDELCEIFKVSQVEVGKGPGDSADTDRLYGAVSAVDKADGEKCQRCWNYSHSVGKDSGHPEICERCLKAIGGVKSEE